MKLKKIIWKENEKSNYVEHIGFLGDNPSFIINDFGDEITLTIQFKYRDDDGSDYSLYDLLEYSFDCPSVAEAKISAEKELKKFVKNFTD